MEGAIWEGVLVCPSIVFRLELQFDQSRTWIWVLGRGLGLVGSCRCGG